MPVTGLQGRVCVVTGAGRGIGAAIAEAFAAEGARLALLDRHDERGATTTEKLSGNGAEACHYQVDVTDEVAVAAAARRIVADFGSVDVLVNNAGILRVGPSMSFPLQDWHDTLDVMVTGVFLCSREFGRAMRTHQGGSIINITSINALTAFPMRLAYSAAKAAVVSMTKVLAVEWASYGIRVNAVAPGITHTELNKTSIDKGLLDLDACLQHTPQRRFAEPSEVADSVVYLASDQARHVTGDVLTIDGGWTASGWISWTGDPEDPDLRPA